jgi:tRNA A37 methylthiotransferase MiaB
MADQVPAPVKAERVDRLAALERTLRDRYFASLLGRRLEVLVESTDGVAGTAAGTSCRYAPVEVAGDESDIGRFVLATAGRVADGRIVAQRPSAR